MKKIIFLLFIILCVNPLFSSEFDELDKPPEGSHSGQMLLRFCIALGAPVGTVINAEKDFVENSTYTFEETDITKELLISHMYISFGGSFEYMFIDHLGAQVKLKKNYIMQRTSFGSQYENWSNPLYKDYSLYLGPTFHLTTRKMWDVSLSLFAGYSFGTFYATPVADEILENKVDSVVYNGPGEKSVNGFSAGTELNFLFYFSGGLFVSIGFDWTMNMLDFGSEFNLQNPQTSANYFSGETSSTVHSLGIIISAGYAFMN